MNKYRNRKTEIDGILFDSAKESRRYKELRLLERAGLISNLELQPKFRIEINGVKVCDYRADFAFDEKGQRTIEDVKSTFTAKNPVYRIKKKLLKAVLNLEIKEV